MTEMLIVEPYGPATLDNLPSDLTALQIRVGGYIEAVSPAAGNWHAYCDEEGKLIGLPVNVPATQLAHLLGWPQGDILSGTVVFLGDGKDGEEDDVPEAVVQQALEIGINIVRGSAS